MASIDKDAFKKEMEKASSSSPPADENVEAASDEKKVEVKAEGKVPVTDFLMAFHIRSQHSGTTTVVQQGHCVDDHVVCKWKDNKYYNARVTATRETKTISPNSSSVDEKSVQSLYDVVFEDGAELFSLPQSDLIPVPPVRARPINNVNVNSQPFTLEFSDGTVATTSCPNNTSYPFSHVFDCLHGRVNSPGCEWWGIPNGESDVRLDIVFPRPLYITKLRIYPFNGWGAPYTSNYSLHVTGPQHKRLALTNGVLVTSNYPANQFDDYALGKLIKSIHLVFPNAAPNGCTLGGIDVYSNAEHMAASTSEPSQTPDAVGFFKDLAYLFDNEDFSDITFAFNDEEKHTIHAHKAILAARSLYYRTMFTGQMHEASSKVIPMHEIPYPTFYAVIRYIYTNLLNTSTLPLQTLIDVWKAADQYQIAPLQQLAHGALRQALTLQDAFSLYQALQSEHPSLLSLVEQILLDNFPRAMQLKEFTDLPPELLHAILSKAHSIYFQK